MFSTIGCQLPRHSDYYWLESVVSDIIQEKFGSFVPNDQSLTENFLNFRLENRNYDRPISGVQNRQVKVNLNAVESMEKVRTHIEQVYNRYKEEFGYHQINIFISENACNHIIRIHRVLTFTQKYLILIQRERFIG